MNALNWNRLKHRVFVRLHNALLFAQRRTNIKSILLIPEFSSFGGTRTYLLTLLRFYNKYKFKVTILLDEKNVDEEIINQIVDYEFKYIIFDISSIHSSSKNIDKTLLSQEVKLIWSLYLKGRFDLIVFSIGTPGNFLNSFIFPTRVLYVLHTYPTHNYIQQRQRKILSTLLGPQKRILTVSEFSKTNIVDHWKLSHKTGFVNVIYNTTIVEKPKLEYDQHNKGELIVTTLGHVETYKNPFVWVEVARKCIDDNPSIKLKFIWAGDGTLLNDCVKKVSAYGLSSQIRFIEPASNVSDLLHQTDIYFQPSLIESFGLSVLEAMSNHKPCVVSNKGGLPEVVTDEVSGFLVDPDDIETMSSKINLLVQNQKIRSKMGDEAFNQYMIRFSESVWENEMLSLYHDII